MGAQQSSAGSSAQTSTTTSGSTTSSTKPVESKEQLPLLAPADILLHSSPGDCWIVVHGLVYDVTTFLRSHPGGQEVLLERGGRDATDGFELAFHPAYVREEMAQYLVGRVDKQAPPAVANTSSTTTALTPAESKAEAADEAEEQGKRKVRVKFIYGSQLGQGQRFADRLAETCEELSKNLTNSYLDVSIQPMNELDPEDLGSEEYVVFIVSTYTEGTPPDTAKFFCEWLTESSVDFRVGEAFMSKVTYTVLGLGNSLYDAHYNVVAKKMFQQLPTMGGTLLCELGLCDESVSRPDQLSAEEDFTTWMNQSFLPNLVVSIEQPKAFAQKVAIAKSKAKTAARAEARAARREKDKREAREYNLNAPDAKDAEEEAADEKKAKEKAERVAQGLEDPDEYASASDGGEDEDDEGEEAQDEDGEGSDTEKVVDIEQLGSVLTKQGAAAKTASAPTEQKDGEKPAPRAMLTDQLRKNLSKQGYKLIGSHSGVKLCRWTKAMLRGRGGCYKHTMYGIMSYQCMEMTPSLACANKCVFCWRHHTNPVGREWRWQVDEPRMILDNAIVNHRAMINVMKGVPGVLPDRLADAQTPKHCALSLVGEPIMYPHINQFVRMLHEEDISSFLVTNAQFPDRIRDMDPVCQLYVSIDASTQETLKAVDRPLFPDFWDRFLACLAEIKKKQQRTVYRMTLVKSFNMQEVIEYAKLVSIGRPTFIEIKGVTFCGKSGAGEMTLKDVPLHEEVKSFAEQLCKYLDGNYEMASEHEHSCCVLISDTKLKKDGKWHTWIDYPKFNQLVREYYATGKTFSAEDYGAETPAWAVYNSAERGFNPSETKKTGKRQRPTLEQLNQKFPGINESNRQAQQASIAAGTAEMGEERTGCCKSSSTTSSDTTGGGCCKTSSSTSSSSTTTSIAGGCCSTKK